MKWLVYIILCSDDTLYAGITTDLQRRFAHHTSGHGAKYFRGRRPLEVVARLLASLDQQDPYPP